MKRDEYDRDLIVKMLCGAIKRKQVVRFHYRSKDYEDWRKVDPYIVAINEKGNIFLSGFFTPTTDQLKDGKTAKQGNYVLDKFKEGSLEMIDENFDRLKVEPEKIYYTPTIKVICRVSFD